MAIPGYRFLYIDTRQGGTEIFLLALIIFYVIVLLVPVVVGVHIIDYLRSWCQ